MPKSLRRPLHLWVWGHRGGCPATPLREHIGGVGPTVGAGPVSGTLSLGRGGTLPFGIAGNQPWASQEVIWVARPSYKGPILIRGRQLGGPGFVGFDTNIKTVERGPLDELQLTGGAGTTTPGDPPGARIWMTLIRVRTSGCYAVQIDGTNFSHVIVFRTRVNTTPVLQRSGPVPQTLNRPLHLPALKPGAACPESRASANFGWSGPMVGPAPVYTSARGRLPFVNGYPGSGWFDSKFGVAATPAYRGPLYLRGHQLSGPHQLRFGYGPDSGELLRNDNTVGLTGAPLHWRIWVVLSRVRAAGCYGLQIDGTSSSRVVVFEAKVR